MNEESVGPVPLVFAVDLSIRTVPPSERLSKSAEEEPKNSTTLLVNLNPPSETDRHLLSVESNFNANVIVLAGF